MFYCVVVDSFTWIGVSQRFALIFSGKSLEEACYLIHLSRCKLHTALIDTHITDSLFEGFTGTVMVVRPCMLDIAKSWNLKAMTVTLDLSLLVTSVILVSEFETTALSKIESITASLNALKNS